MSNNAESQRDAFEQGLMGVKTADKLLISKK